MSEYWKSNPRKFCDFCKCWIAENKPSIEFHERGKRHKENVQIRLAELAQKGKEDYEAQQQEGDFLKAMEEAALKAYKNDIAQNPDMTGTKISEIATSKNAEIVVASKKPPEEPKPKETVTVKKWYEAKSPEGYCYYWNIETGASKWEEPEEGFLTLAEQENLKKKDKPKKSSDESKTDKKESKTDKKESKTDKKESKTDKKESKTDKKESKTHKKESNNESKKNKKEGNSSTFLAPPIVYGPVQKTNAYSSWKQIKMDPEPSTDYQLPKLPEEEYYVPEISFKRPEVSFAEKTVTLSASDKGGGGTVSFKKRKGTQDNKKSMRQRTNDL